MTARHATRAPTAHQTRTSLPSGSLRLRSMPVILLALLLSACANTATSPATPPAPTPPQITVANAVNALAQTMDAAITSLQTAKTQGKISAADLANAEKVAAIIATAGKSIDTELRSADDWTTQKNRILGIVTSAGVTGALANVPPAAAAFLSAGVALFNQVSQAVGGPTII